MEGLRRNGRGKKGANCPETRAEREKKERKKGEMERENARESKRVIALQQHLMASLERGRGREWRGGEGIMRWLRQRQR